MFKPDLKSLPTNPGIYIYRDKFKNIIYIGKAKKLKNRISTYFNSKHNLSPKTKVLIKNIKELEYIIVDNEIEALLLENKLIKKHKPKYNINLKDSKTYAYIKITNEKIPKIRIARKIDSKADYFGPYTSSSLRNEIIEIVIKIFNLITPKTYSNKSNLNYEIGIAPARIEKEIEIGEYLKKVNQAKEFLKGKNISKIIQKLKNEMLKAAEIEEFEIANEKKKQIESILNLKERQKVDLVKKFDQDILYFQENQEKTKSSILSLNISKGIISSKREFKFKDYDGNLFEEFIKMYYSQNSCPKEIIINYEFFKTKKEKEIIEKYLSKIRGSKIRLTLPKKGEKYQLLQMAKKNIIENFEENNVLLELKKKLNLKKIPNIIECFDMSNLGKEDLVGGMIQFKNEKENISEYRKYNIKSFAGKNDDFTAMKEVLTRRYSKLKKENLNLPDLIILDGGNGQLNIGIEVLKKLNLDINLISIAKGKTRKNNEIYLPNQEEPLLFENNSKMIIFLRKIRDTSHNYVIHFNRKKRNMKLEKQFKEI